MSNEDDRPYKGGLSRFVTFVLMPLSVFDIGMATFFPLTFISEGHFMLCY